MTDPRQEPGTTPRSGHPRALVMLIALVILVAVWQGWPLVSWRRFQGPPAMSVFQVSLVSLSLASAWGLWHRRAWGWWLAGVLAVMAVSLFLLGEIFLFNARASLAKMPAEQGRHVPVLRLFRPAYFVTPFLSVLQLGLLFRREVLSPLGGKAHSRGRRAAILVGAGIIGQGALAGILIASLSLPGHLGMPTPFSPFDHVSGTATLLRDGRVLLAGEQGIGGKMTAEFYSPASNAFKRAPDMPHARAFTPVAILLLDGRVLVAGGRTPTHGNVEAIDIFDPKRNAWATAGKFAPKTRIADATVLQDGGVLFSTEEGGAEGLLRFDLASGKLEPVGHPDMVVNGSPLVTPLRDGKILVTHLEYGEPASLHPNAFLFDPVARMTTALPRMAQDRSQHQATLLADGRVLVTGGAKGMPSAELFDPLKGTFGRAGEMLAPRSLHRAVRLADGRVLILGGVSSTPTVSQAERKAIEGKSPDEIVEIGKNSKSFSPGPLEPECEIFDPRVNRFSAAPPPPFLSNEGMGPRTGLHLLLPDGRVLFMGSLGPVVFDPRDSTWHSM